MDRQKITVDLAFSSSAHFVAKLASYIVLSILARYLPKEEMGAFFFAATLATFFALFTDLGTNKYLNREVSEKPANSLLYLNEVFSLRLVLQVVFLFTLYVFTLITKPEIITTVILTSVYIFLENLFYSFSAFFLGLRNVKIYAVTWISTKLLLVALVMIAIAFNATFNVILFCYIIANAVLILFSILQVWRISGAMAMVWDFETEARIIRASFPFFLVTFLTMLQFNIDTLMLGFMQPYADVATYTSGFKILEVSQFVIRPLIAVFFPISARLAVQGNWKEFKTLLQRLLFGTSLLGLLVIIGILLDAENVMLLVFGPKYLSTAGILRILFLCAPFIYMWMIGFSFAMALHIEVKVVRVMVVGVSVNSLFNLAGIYFIGIAGAAWATVFSQMLMTAWLIYLIWKQLQIRKQPISIERQYITTVLE